MQFPTTILAIAAFAGLASAAIPPACVINALGQQPNPADMDAICTTYQPSVLGNLTSSCTPKANLDAAYEHYSSLCLTAASVTVEDLPSTTTDSSTSTSTTATSGGSSGSTSGSDNDDDGESSSEDAAAAESGAVAGSKGSISSGTLLWAAGSGLLAIGLTNVVFL